MMRMSSNGVVSSPTPIGPYSPVKNGRLNTAPSRQGTAMTEGSTMMVDNGPEGVWGKPSSPGGTVESPSRPSTQSRWMDRMMLESTRMLEPRGNSDFVVGYTGHVPRVRETFAVNNKVASNAIYEKSSGIGSMTRVADVQGGRRLLVTTPTTQLPGTGTFATTTSIGRVRKEGYENLDVYHQGYKVHLQSYYESCAANGYKDILIKAGFAGKNRSNIDVGDPFYYSGKQMYETSQREAYKKADDLEEEDHDSEAEKLVKRNTNLRKYALVKAVVGSERLEDITNSLKEKIHARVSGGVGLRRRMFQLFDKNGTGDVDVKEFREVIFHLGIKLSENETCALFATVDANGDGSLNFYEFLDAFAVEGAAMPQRRVKLKRHL